MRAFLLALLLATSAVAQPIVGPEVSTPPIDLGDSAIAPLRDGFVAAWSDGDRIHVAHLDATLSATEATLDVLLVASSSRLTALAIAANGTSALLVWNEQRPGYAETYVAAISPDARLLLGGPLLLNHTNLPAAISVNAGKYEILSGEQLFVVNEQLEIEATKPAGSFVASAVGTNGDTATVTMTPETTCTKVDYFFGSCTLTYTFTFRSPSYARGIAVPANFFNPTVSPLLHDPIVIPHGDHFLGVLATKTTTAVFEMSPATRNVEWDLDPLGTSQVLSVASNGNDVLVVTWKNPTLNGTVLHADGTISAPFEIAHGAYNFPKVVATSSNDFVVLYRYDAGSQRSILAGRVIHLQSPKHRALR